MTGKPFHIQDGYEKNALVRVLGHGYQKRDSGIYRHMKS